MTKTVTYEDLKPEHQAFIDNYILNGGSRDAATTAVQVVYGYDRDNATRYAGRLLQNKRIIAVLREKTLSTFAALHVMAAEKLAEVIDTGMWHGQKVKPSDGLKAIKEALERGIGPVVHRQEIEVTDNRSLTELKAHVVNQLSQLSDADKREFAAKLGLAAIDADFAPVEPTIDPAAPWGRKKDGTPRAQPGTKKIFLPGPEAVKPEDYKNDIEAVRARLKRRALDNRSKAANKEKASEQSS